MDIKDLKLLIKLVTETDITEFEMDNSDEKIIIKRGHKPEYITVASPAPQQYAHPGYQPAATAAPVARGRRISAVLHGRRSACRTGSRLLHASGWADRSREPHTRGGSAAASLPQGRRCL